VLSHRATANLITETKKKRTQFPPPKKNNNRKNTFFQIHLALSALSHPIASIPVNA